jgi:hypothetical protein
MIIRTERDVLVQQAESELYEAVQPWLEKYQTKLTWIELTCLLARKMMNELEGIRRHGRRINGKRKTL